MARRLIGLDVGTSAVTVAEVTPGDPPTLRAFGRVALPHDAGREGEIVDEAAVAAAIDRLRSEVGLRKGPVRVGLASPRVIVRQVEMPVMTRAELAGALQYQASELIPIPVDDAVLDFAILDTFEPPDSEEQVMRVLLAAAQRPTVARLVEAVEGGGFSVENVDLVPLALIRSLARPVADDGPGAEGIVSFGAGVTCVTVHEGGVPRFVRVIGSGGRGLTEAVASRLDIPFDAAESLKRQLDEAADDLVSQARSAMDAPLGTLLDEVRSSFDYYRNQPGATRLLRVVATGGGARLDGLTDRLSTLVGLPVDQAAPRTRLAIGDVGFEEGDLPRLDPYLPVAVGLALGAVTPGPVIDFAQRGRRAGAGPRRKAIVGGAVAAAALVALLAVPTLQRRSQLDDERAARDAQERKNQQIQQQISALADAQAKQAQLQATQAQVVSLLQTDVSWSRLLQEIARTIPNDVWLTNFQGSVTQPAARSGGAATTTTTAAGAGTTATTAAAGTSSTTAVPGAAPGVAGGTITGPVSFSAVGLDYPSVAAWLQRIAEIPSLTDLWVPSASKATSATLETVDFQSTATLTPEARSDRRERFEEGDE